MNTTLTTPNYKASRLLQLRNHLLRTNLEQHLFEQSLFHVKKMLREEFGIRFATYFEQQYPKAFYQLVKTTQTRITWLAPEQNLFII
jgi:hypothetical protein